jgi:hypothetical protein
MSAGAIISVVPGIVGDPTVTGEQGPVGIVAGYSLTAGVNIPAAGGTGELECSQDHTNAVRPYADAGTSLWAHRVSTLTTGTE